MHCILIKEGHVSTVFAESLAESDTQLELIKYSSFTKLFQHLKERESGNKVYLHSPDFNFIFLVILFYKKFKFRYFLHEPYISYNRSPSITFWLGYHLWLFLIQFFCSFIFLSKKGMNLANKKFFLVRPSKFLGVLPIAIDEKKLSIKNAPSTCFDFIMWGSLNHEKGLDRFIQVARRLPNKSFAVMSRSNNYLQSLKKINSDLKNFKWFLSKRFIDDKEIFRFIDSSKFAFMLQRESTQSGQLPLALALGKSVFASDAGSFPEFLNEAKFSKVFQNSKPENEMIDDVVSYIKIIEGHENAAQNEAKLIFKNNFDSQSSTFKNWTKNF